MSEPRVAHAMFCDDVRMEIGNKPSFMGCYSGDMGIPMPFPAKLPKFGFFLVLICDIDDSPEFIEAFVKLPDGKELLRQKLPPAPRSIAPGSKKISYNAVVQVAPLPLPCAGTVEAWIETEQGPLRAGSLMVKSIFPLLQQPQVAPTS